MNSIPYNSLSESAPSNASSSISSNRLFRKSLKKQMVHFLEFIESTYRVRRLLKRRKLPSRGTRLIRLS
jgi:hypothetical protein